VFQKSNKFIKKFIKKELSFKIKKEYFSELEEPYLIISLPALINQKNSFTRKQIDQDLFKIIEEEGMEYIKEFNIKVEGDTGYYLKKIHNPSLFLEQKGRIIFLFIVEGEGVLKINNQKYKLKENDCFLFPSHFTYNYILEANPTLTFVYSFIE
jgi:mannose-6-phosphate isomerase-like protein (cupin superfamily)